MDPPAICAETFVLKIYISSRADEKKVEKILENIQGVHRIFRDQTEIGKITIVGTMDPKTLLQILWYKGIDSKQVFEPKIIPRDFPGVSGPKTPVKTYHAPINKETVEGLEKLSKLKGFDTVELTKDAMKLKYKKDENIRHRDGKNGSCSRNMDENATHKKGEQAMNNYCYYHGNYKSHCPGNQGMSVQDSHDCGTNSRNRAPPEGITKGISSSQPVAVENYARPQKRYSDHGSTNKHSDDNSPGFFVFFFLFIFVLVIQLL